MGAASGRAWAYGAAGLGGGVSVAANVAHSYVPPKGAALDWQPQLGAVLGAVFWPLALFVVIEVLARNEWPAGVRWLALRWAGLVPVAAVAAVVSYRHLSGLLAFYGEDQWTAMFGPLAVDGLMVMATGALIATSGPRADRTTGPDQATPDHPVRVVQVHDAGPEADRPALLGPDQDHHDSRTGPDQEGTGPDRADHGPADHPAPVRTAAAADRPHAVHAPIPDHAPRTVHGPDGPPPDRSAGTSSPRVPADLITAAWAVVDDLGIQPQQISRRTLAEGLRARGHKCSTDRASRLLAAIATTTTEQETH